MEPEPGDKAENNSRNGERENNVADEPSGQNMEAAKSPLSGDVKKIWTVGHSTRSIEEFTELLRAHGIHLVADVRQFPGSRRYPQFNKEKLIGSLAQIEMSYVHLPELGGRRKAQPHSRNTSWRNASFRGYADYMETVEFQRGMERLKGLAKEPTAIMCAEALWWRCHRRLIADYLKALGYDVLHILSEAKCHSHSVVSPTEARKPGS